MKRNTKIVLAALAAVSITTGTLAMAKGGRMGDRMVNRLSERLELTEQQVGSLELLQMEIADTRQLMRSGLDSDGQTLKNLIAAETFDQGAALEMITARTTAMQAQGPELVAAAAQFLDGLETEQKQELSELMDRFTDRHGDRKRNSK